MTSQAVSVQTSYIVSTATALNGSPSPVTLIQTVEVTASTDSSGQTTPKQPSGTESPSAIPTPGSLVPMPAPYIYDVIIDGQTYHLPSPDEPDETPVPIILKGGMEALFSHEQVTIGGEIISAQFSETKKIKIQGHEYEVGKKEGKSFKPSGGGGGGIGGLFKGLAKAAGTAIKGVSGEREAVFNLAQDIAHSGGGGVADTLSKAGNQVDDIVSSINGIQNSLPTDKLTQSGLDTVLNVQGLGRQASNFLASTADLVKDLPVDIQDKVYDNIKEFAGEEGPLKQAEDALKSFEDFPWQDELPLTQIPSATQNPSASVTGPPSRTSMPTETASSQSSQVQTRTQSNSHSTSSFCSTTSFSNTTTTAEPTPTDCLRRRINQPDQCPTKTKYFIVTKDGTSLEDFNRFIEEVDGKAGQALAADPKLVPHQSYLTRLEPSIAEGLQEKYGFIRWVYPFVFHPDDLAAAEEASVILPNVKRNYSTAQHLDNKVTARESMLSPRAWIDRPAHDPWWKRMISSPPLEPPNHPNLDPHYRADDSRGRGVTTYVIDDGFDLDREDFDIANRRIDTHVVDISFAAPEEFL
ncbi:hypothetical protein BU23DRAFT_107373 [Bimuria novae-zelandiae CBS 107.79]|uniref:Uncharacterized protein n=1 Tax=Bimuria novae-zelandiae CBS 107.79 TaxID=1447943 RepID=A0A6A5VR76_9PLEO|nr:hypothetical protein BU23DRAFT_107373 [Bimuria novae-zelandiae CBS 107.79]